MRQIISNDKQYTFSRPLLLCPIRDKQISFSFLHNIDS